MDIMLKSLACGLGFCLLSSASFAATYYADTDGDGTADTITTVTSGTTGVRVFHPNTGATKFYTISGGFNVHSIVDTNGAPGAEIIINRPTGLTSTNGITVIHDRNGTSSNYLYAPGVPFSINSIADTDGQPGSEIIVDRHAASSLYSGENGISIVNDRTQTKQLYWIDLYAGFSIRNVTNYDGIAGAEVCYNTNNPWQYWMIVDRTKSKVYRTAC